MGENSDGAFARCRPAEPRGSGAGVPGSLTARLIPLVEGRCKTTSGRRPPRSGNSAGRLIRNHSEANLKAKIAVETIRRGRTTAVMANVFDSEARGAANREQQAWEEPRRGGRTWFLWGPPGKPR